MHIRESIAEHQIDSALFISRFVLTRTSHFVNVSPDSQWGLGEAPCTSPLRSFFVPNEEPVLFACERAAASHALIAVAESIVIAIVIAIVRPLGSCQS